MITGLPSTMRVCVLQMALVTSDACVAALQGEMRPGVVVEVEGTQRCALWQSAQGVFPAFANWPS